ncbi:DUF4194 domain-containing protein [Agromyces italicus]|uniref:DUF4194 domain-containing protein n=1 Tax=Agromyces italicus TaxID=279572 RepID=UPI00146C8C12|nr:DUF4194 domain-containing protein [Agromyces italicus]
MNDPDIARHFDGDNGVLPFDVREAIARIQQGPFLDGYEHTRLWSAVITRREDVQRHFAETFQVLYVDREKRTAFVRQAETDTPFPVLLRRAPLNLVESAVIIHLRRRLVEEAGTGAPVVVNRKDVQDEVLTFRQAGNTDESGRRKAVNGAITKFQRNGILKPIRDTDDRFTITPVLHNLFKLDEVSRLVAALKSMDGGADSYDETQGGDDD